MVILAVIALVSGVAVGLLGLDTGVVHLLTTHSDSILDVLMLLVGISIGMQQGIFQKIRQYHLRIFLIPAGVIAGTLMGGVVCSLLTGYSLRESEAVVSGLGWYSLAGITVSNLAGAQLGSITFLSNLLREILSFFSIPLIARCLNDYTCIAPAAATSEDTTLPMMIRYTSEETVVLSVFNGVICSACVPVLIALCFGIH